MRKTYFQINLFIVLFFWSLGMVAGEKNDGDSLPFVLSVPGFLVPGVPFDQESHFGKLAEIMRSNGIPYKCVIYNSKDHPLTKVADLLSDKYSISVTRVVPEILQSIEDENIRRAKEGSPPVKDVVLVPYSQGAVIALNFYFQLIKYRNQYESYHEQLGKEFESFISDPLMSEVIFATDIFTSINNVKNQREQFFIRDKDLNMIYSKTYTEFRRRFEKLYKYIINPSSVYPGITDFDPPETEKYPKNYPRLRKYFLSILRNEVEKQKMIDFIMNHSIFHTIKDIDFRFFFISGSFFGSPDANIGYDILYRFPLTQNFVSGVEQIKDTRLGNAQHIKGLLTLLESEWDKKYPFNDKNTMFIVGADEEEGDGLVAQPCAHLSQHRYLTYDAKDYVNNPNNEIVPKKYELPKLRVVPLNVRHFPVKTFFGLGPTIPGSAYITEKHPTLDYLIPFIRKDYQQLENMENKNRIHLQQFMISFYIGRVGADVDEKNTARFQPGSPELKKIIKELNAKIKIIKLPHDFILQGQFFNADNFTFVFLGAYDDKVDTSKEQKMVFRLTARYYPPKTFSIPVKAGTCTFIRIYDSDK